MKKQELIEAIHEIDPEFNVSGMAKPELEEVFGQLGGDPVSTAPTPAEQQVLMYRPDRGEVSVPEDDVPNMLKNGWSRSDGRAGEWVKRADVPRLIREGVIDINDNGQVERYE